MHRSRSEWAAWAKQAIQKGARLAHKVTQNRAFQSVLDTEWAGSAQVLPQPNDAADAELGKWKQVWSTHTMDGDIQKKFQGMVLQGLPPYHCKQFGYGLWYVPKAHHHRVRWVSS